MSCLIISFSLHTLVTKTQYDFSYMEDEEKAHDTRWIHRPFMDWEKAEKRHVPGTVEQRIFEGLSRMIAVRKNTPAFADFNNRELITTGNPHLFVFIRNNPFDMNDEVMVIGNFHNTPQSLTLSDLGNRGQYEYGQLKDLCTGEAPAHFKDQLVIPPFHFYWLKTL